MMMRTQSTQETTMTLRENGYELIKHDARLRIAAPAMLAELKELRDSLWNWRNLPGLNEMERAGIENRHESVCGLIAQAEGNPSLA
jgi:hypothetical protein